jgi:hypothetical protein
MKTFTLSYDPTGIRVSSNQVVAYIKNHRDIIQWYVPFAGTCVFKSNKDLLYFAASFRELFDGVPFLISLTSPVLMGGALDSHVWEWLNTGILPALPTNLTSE